MNNFRGLLTKIISIYVLLRVNLADEVMKVIKAVQGRP